MKCLLDVMPGVIGKEPHTSNHIGGIPYPREPLPPRRPGRGLGIIGRGFADNNRPTRLAAEARPLLDGNLLATWRPKE